MASGLFFLYVWGGGRRSRVEGDELLINVMVTGSSFVQVGDGVWCKVDGGLVSQTFLLDEGRLCFCLDCRLELRQKSQFEFARWLGLGCFEEQPWCTVIVRLSRWDFIGLNKGMSWVLLFCALCKYCPDRELRNPESSESVDDWEYGRSWS